MLPFQPHLDFIVRWSEVSDVPAFVPGTLISGGGTYAANNINAYWRIGKCLGKSHTQELYEIVDQRLQKEDGSCNLGLTYIVISASRNHNRLGRVLLRIDEALADTELSGDAKASWYLAKAFALETAMQPMIKPGRGLPELREALGVVESDEFRSRLHREIIARLVTLGQDDEAKAIASDFQHAGFQEQYTATELQRWTLSLQHYVNSVKKHLETARLKNDTDNVVRFQNVLTEFESKQ